MAGFSLKSLLPFGPPEIFRILGGCRTRASASASALKHLRRPKIAAHSGGLGIPSNAQAPLAKSSIRSKSRQRHLSASRPLEINASTTLAIDPKAKRRAHLASRYLTSSCIDSENNAGHNIQFQKIGIVSLGCRIDNTLETGKKGLYLGLWSGIMF